MKLNQTEMRADMDDAAAWLESLFPGTHAKAGTETGALEPRLLGSAWVVKRFATQCDDPHDRQHGHPKDYEVDVAVHFSVGVYYFRLDVYMENVDVGGCLHIESRSLTTLKLVVEKTLELQDDLRRKE